MAESDAGFYPIATLYETHPHILTDIMYYCTPTTFDAFRYTCKAVYSMSLDPDLLEHHLKIIVNRQHELVSIPNRAPRFYYDVIYMDSKFDTIQNSHGNLWRLRGQVLQEFLRMRSSWRIGDYKKVVVELDVHPEEDNEVGNNSGNGPWFDGTVQIFSGAVRGDTFAVSWSDTKQTHLHTYLFTNAQKYANDEDEGPVDLAYELDWDQRRSWKVPATDLSNAPNVTLPGHCDEAMNLLLGKNGKCESKGYAIGLDSRPHQKWKVHEPRRLKEDVSRLGVWRDVSVEFERGLDGKETILRVLATISKNLIKPNPQKRFLLTNSKILNPDDWADVQIPLVLPPVTREDRHGRLVLATVAPAAYFRKLGMRDPHIHWADKGFMDYNWDTKKNAEGEIGPELIFIRTGAIINSELVDAEIVTRVVGWTDDGAVWVWDVTEKHILDAGELSMEQDSSQVLDVTAKKLGYVKDVKGIFVTGDRLVQRITLVTYGKEQKVHRVGEEHGGGNDAGISFLRQEDITRKINEAKAKKAAGEQGEFQNGHGDRDGYGEVSVVPQLEATDDLADDTRRWRMINYCYGYPKGGGSATYRIDHSGDVEDI
ncbi:hypothetical protein TWF703_001735 [Orbilia oligospora]|uniref:Uncharacterized protein n=1 Tax=Orbilia oligospora TaxID=2813651 RepID=A0A7C8JV87_ORBOL|nr:hypothetical protein TWF703_001735 [Orbilia oligospora]